MVALLETGVANMHKAVVLDVKEELKYYQQDSYKGGETVALTCAGHLTSIKLSGFRCLAVECL